MNAIVYDITCQSVQNFGTIETFQIVDENVWCPQIVKKLKGHWIPETRLHMILGDDPALLPHHTEVHGHGDGELLVIDGEDVKDLHIDVNMNRINRPW